jgi:hypothetical protein
MSATDDRVATVRAEIEQVRRARLPVDQIVAAALTELDSMAERARVAPGQWPLPVSNFEPQAMRRMLLGMFATIAPKETRAMIEAATRETEKARSGLRLSEAQKAQRLTKLTGELHRLEAAAELERREQERGNPDLVMPRSAFDPAIWSLTMPELQRMAA